MPENQNMQKTSDNEAMLQEIVQNTEMGKNTLDELMAHRPRVRAPPHA